jgi:hypothetical protein
MSRDRSYLGFFLLLISLKSVVRLINLPLITDKSMVDNIFFKLNQIIDKITENDIDNWILNDIFELYKSKIDRLIYKAYNLKLSDEVPESLLRSFRARAKQELRNALYVFFCKLQHWRDGRDLNLYLLKCINILPIKIYKENNTQEKVTAPICPACRCYGKIERLDKDGKYFRCKECAKEINIISNKIDRVTSVEEKASLESRLMLHRAFVKHSKKGYRCPECVRFIPESSATEFGVSCPYINCSYCGASYNLDKKSHPTKQFSRNILSLNFSLNQGDGGDFTLEDTLTDYKIVFADDQLEHKQRFIREHDVLKDVIENQIRLISRNQNKSTFVKKKLMYEAFKIMLANFPEEMISYLVHLKHQTADFPIHARIFQEYSKLVENYLPFSIVKNGETIDIVSLTDPNLALFLGISEFKAHVTEKRTIPNKTEEKYIGGRKFKDYGPCFIGRLIDVKSLDAEESLMGAVKEYSFSKISMNDTVLPGTPVHVTHFRIPSHYEIDSLVFLQRIRRQIVDSVYFRLNNKKREVRKKRC